MNDDDWDFFNKSVGKLEKEVITLKKENERLKENIHSMLFTDDVIQKRYEKALKENTKLKKLVEIAKGFIFRCANDISGDWYINSAKCALKQIEELEK